MAWHASWMQCSLNRIWDMMVLFHVVVKFILIITTKATPETIRTGLYLTGWLDWMSLTRLGSTWLDWVGLSRLDWSQLLPAWLVCYQGGLLPGYHVHLRAYLVSGQRYQGLVSMQPPLPLCPPWPLCSLTDLQSQPWTAPWSP